MNELLVVGPELQTGRLMLRIPEPGEAAAVASYLRRNRRFHGPWAPLAPEAYYSDEFWTAQLAREHDSFARDQSLHLFFTAHEGGEMLGRCHFSSFVRGAFCACYLGYDLDEQAQGNGYMQEALGVAIPYVFENLGLHRIMANYIPTNERSGRLLRRMGFTIEGYARDYLKIAGRWQDHILTSLTNPKP